jgi:two-component system response regulator NreC
MQQGLRMILAEVKDFGVVFSTDNKTVLQEKLKTNVVHVLILNIHDGSVRYINLIVQLMLLNPKLKILVLSYDETEPIILKTLKAGAKGFLGRDSQPQDLIEAIFTLRNGFDFFNKSITQMLLNRYINNLQGDEDDKAEDINSLSTRQIEILKLWGNSCTNQEIAEQLFISVRTVESHKNHIMQKLKLKNTVDLVKFSIKNNIIEI